MSGGTVGRIIQTAAAVAQFVPGINALAWGYRAAIFVGAQVVGGYLRRSDGATADHERYTQFNVRSNEAAMRVIYGRAKVGVQIADTRLGTSNEDDLYVVGVLCLGSEDGSGIEALERIWFDDLVAIQSPEFESEPNTTSVTAAFTVDGTPKLEYGAHAGSDTQVVDAMLDSEAGYNSTHVGRGIAYIALKLIHDEQVYRGIPVIQALVQGQKVYDPRLNSGAGGWAWSENPALCALDYLTSKRYGVGALYSERDGGTRSEIDEQSFIDAANYCEENALSRTRFTCNGVIDTGRSIAANLQQILSSCRGELIYEGGKFRLHIRQPQTAETFELTDADIIGDVEFWRGGIGDAPNRVVAHFIDEDSGYRPNSVTWPAAGQTNTFLTNDADWENTAEIQLPMTLGYYRARNMAMTFLREAREDQGCILTAREEAIKYQVGSVISVTHTHTGLSGAEFWVRAMALNPDSTVRLVLQEYDVDAYSLDADDTRDTLPDADLPDPTTVAAPTDVTATSDTTTAADLGNGAYQPRIRLDWTASTGPFLRYYEVQFRTSAGPGAWTSAPDPIATDEQTFIGSVGDGVDYDIRIRAVNRIGVASEWVQIDDHTVAGLPEPRIDDITYAFNASDELVVTLKTVQAGAVRVAAGSSRPSDATVDAAALELTDADGLASVNLGSGYPTSVIVRARAYQATDGTGLASGYETSDVFKVTYLEAEGGTIGGWDITDTDLAAGGATGLRIESDTRRILMGAASAPLTGVGIFLGLDGSDWEFRAGDPGGDYIHWDGTDLTISGDIEASGGTIGGFDITATDIIAGSGSARLVLESDTQRIMLGAATAPLTGEGVFLGLSGGEYQARFGDPGGDYFLWDGTTIVLGGEIITAANIPDSELDGSHLSALSFSGKTAVFDTGSIGGWLMSASTLHSAPSGNRITIDAANETITIGAASAPLTGAGVFMGSDGASGYDFRAGDPAGEYIHFDASAGTFTIAAESFTGSNPVFAGSLSVRSGEATNVVELGINGISVVSTDGDLAARLFNERSGGVGSILQMYQTDGGTEGFRVSVNDDGITQVSGLSNDLRLVNVEKIFQALSTGVEFPDQVRKTSTGGLSAYLSGVIHKGMTTRSASGTTVTDLETISLPSDTLVSAGNGSGVRLTAWGEAVGLANSKWVNIVWDGTEIFDQIITGANRGFWHLVAEIHRSGATSQRANIRMTYANGASGRTESYSVTGSGAIDLVVQGQCLDAADDLHLYGSMVEYLP